MPLIISKNAMSSTIRGSMKKFAAFMLIVWTRLELLHAQVEIGD